MGVNAVGLERVLRREHPDVIVFWHPVYRTWQLYERRPNSSWDAERLRQVVRYVYATGDTSPFRERDFPRVLEDNLPRAPGEWLLHYLRRVDYRHRRGGARAFLAEVEESVRRRREEVARKRHDVHEAVAYDARRHVRDALRDDPLAGRRRWVHHVDGLGGAR